MTDRKMTKMVGEHWTCASLARHGWAPALTRDGIARTDMLAVATHLANERPTVEIQVKTATKGAARTSWRLDHKAQLLAESDREWFVLVMVPKPSEPPPGFVVPRDHVVAAAWIVHQEWLTNPDVPPGRRNTPLSAARVNEKVWAPYEDARTFDG